MPWTTMTNQLGRVLEDWTWMEIRLLLGVGRDGAEPRGDASSRDPSWHRRGQLLWVLWLCSHAGRWLLRSSWRGGGLGRRAIVSEAGLERKGGCWENGEAGKRREKACDKQGKKCRGTGGGSDVPRLRGRLLAFSLHAGGESCYMLEPRAMFLSFPLLPPTLGKLRNKTCHCSGQK